MGKRNKHRTPEQLLEESYLAMHNKAMKLSKKRGRPEYIF